MKVVVRIIFLFFFITLVADAFGQVSIYRYKKIAPLSAGMHIPYYVIRKDNVTTECTLDKDSGVKMILQVNFDTKIVSGFVVMEMLKQVVFLDQSFDEFKADEAGECSLEEKSTAPLSTIYNAFCSGGKAFEYTVSDTLAVPNYHHSSIFFPEISKLPVVISKDNSTFILDKILTDEEDKLKVLSEINIDLTQYKIMDQEMLEIEVNVMFGMSIKELEEEIERMRLSK